ncbi:MAG: aminotransferase class I/II-fold pyridoxal phosphate-dependent enzyme [Acidobacteriota bacterium]
MSISQIARNISQSATLKLNETAAVLRAKGEPVIHLGGGEPKSKAPIDALITASSKLTTGEIRYTPTDGIPELKKAIIRYTEEFYGRVVPPECVIASGGAKQAIMVALQAVLDPQDEVLFPTPYWVSYPEMVKLCGAVPVGVEAEDGTFYPRIEDFELKASSRTKAVIINSPNNPSGAMYSAEFISDIVRFCEKRDIYLIMDDIYHRLIFDGRKPINCYEFAKSNIQGHQTSGPSALLQWAAVGALNGLQSGVESLRLTLENNRNILVSRLRTIDGVKVTAPDGTFYSFADFRAYEKNSTKLAERLLEKVMVVTVPGVEFGMDGHLRISFCGTIKDITEGVERIKWVLDPNAPNELFIGDRKLVRDWS